MKTHSIFFVHIQWPACQIIKCGRSIKGPLDLHLISAKISSLSLSTFRKIGVLVWMSFNNKWEMQSYPRGNPSYSLYSGWSHETYAALILLGISSALKKSDIIFCGIFIKLLVNGCWYSIKQIRYFDTLREIIQYHEHREKFEWYSSLQH